MRPILFDSRSTDFTTNGIGRIECKSCTVTEERNGAFELTAVVPMTTAHYSDVVVSNIIVARTGNTNKLQPFRIYKVTRPINGLVTVYAEHISYQLNHIPASPFTASSCANALTGFKTNAAESCPFDFSTDIESNSSFAMPEPASIRSYLGGRQGSILDIYGGEYEWDVYNVILHKNRGSDNGVTLRYGKNIVDLKQEENIENTYTGVYPFWHGQEENMVELPEKVLHSPNASNFPYQRTIVLDCTDQFEYAPTVNELRQYATNYMRKNNIGIPNVSIDVNFIDLSQTEQYKDIIPLQSINLCDILTVQFEKLGVNVKTKVIKVVYNVLLEKYDNITVGDAKSTLNSTIEQQIGDATDGLPTLREMNGAIDRATGVLNAGLGGHVMINRNKQGWANEILFLDNENAALAHNIIRINVNGIGFSTTGYNGPYKNAWTIDGKLDASFIQTGSLIVGGGSTNVDGSIIINDASGKQICKMSKDGIVINSGTLTAPTIKGGSITIGNKFSVDSAGKLKATDGEFSGKIKASDMQGGTINGTKITGGEINIAGGKLKANNESVQIGPFYTFESEGGNEYLAFEDESSGIGANGDYQWWTDWDGSEPDIHNPEEILDSYGTVISSQNMYAQELYLSDGIFQGSSHWWGVGETIADIYDRLDDLESRI